MLLAKEVYKLIFVAHEEIFRTGKDARNIGMEMDGKGLTICDQITRDRSPVSSSKSYWSMKP